MKTSMRSARRAGLRCMQLAAAATLLSAGGCGLADYEARIDKQKEYLQVFDEENELLGPPLEMPSRTIKDDKGMMRMEKPFIVEFFVRPPKGIATKFKAEDPPFVYEKLPIVRYEGPKGYNVLATTAIVAPDQKGAPAMEGSIKAKDFKQRVRGALADFFQKQSGKVVAWLSPEFEKLEVESHESRDLRGKMVKTTFEKQELAEQSDKKAGALFYVYFTQTPMVQGAIIYQIPAEVRDNAVLQRALKFSIDSYGLANAAQKRGEYRRMRKM